MSLRKPTDKKNKNTTIRVLDLCAFFMLLPEAGILIIIWYTSDPSDWLIKAISGAILFSLLIWLWTRQKLKKTMRKTSDILLNLKQKTFQNNSDYREKRGPEVFPYRSEIESLSEEMNMFFKEIDIFSDKISLTSSHLSELTNDFLKNAEGQTGTFREMVSTMEDSDSMNHRIAESLVEINRITQNMQKSFNTGFELIRESLIKMDEIASSNKETLTSVQFLGGKIENIWEIVNIINGIADQTKIIAFNAELEASAAGEAGKNFQIVASEIRRLADSTVSSTNEIKTRINEIQHSSDTLIISSEQGTERIKEGNRLSEELQSVFNDVLHLTEITTSSTDEIMDSIEIQVDSFKQILDNLKEVSSQISNNASAGKKASEVQETIQNLIDNFQKKIKPEKSSIRRREE